MKPIADITTLKDLRRILANLPGPDTAAADRAQAREPRLTKPPGALGRLEDLSVWLSAWQGRHPPRIDRPAARVFAGNHGVVARGVSAYPAEVTVQMLSNFQAGGAAINQLCRIFGIQLEVHALDLDLPTRDFTDAAATNDSEFVEAFVRGMNTTGGDQDLLCLGEMGIGNTTAAAAICHGLYGDAAADWTGPGTGVAGDALAQKGAVVAKAVELHARTAADPLDLLRRLGGRELAAIAGAVAGARLNRVPVLLDGYVCTAAAAPLEAFVAGALDHCQVAHVSAEPGHRRLLMRLGKQPLLDLNMRLGEASGAALAVALVKAAAACHAGMATFDEAGVTDKEKN